MDIAERLTRLEVFSHFSLQQLELLAECVSLAVFADGQLILKEGEVTTEAYVIDHGRVRILRETPYGQYPLATIADGDLFGETSFIDHYPRSGDAVAAGSTSCLVLSADQLSGLMERDQRVALALYWSFWKSLSKKLRATNERLTQFFSLGGKAPPSPPVNRKATGEFRIDMAAKRSLFMEQKLAAMEINFLASLSQEKNFAAGETIFRDRDPGDAMYVVLRGRVMISKFIPGAGEEALAFLERGDYFGEMALIDQQPRSADAKAHDGGAVVLRMPREVVEGLLDIRSKVSSLRLLKILSALVAKRLREIDDKLVGWHILAGGGGAGA